MVIDFGGQKLWQLPINSPKFYLPTFRISWISFCLNTESANVFSAKHALGTNPLKCFTAKAFVPTVYRNKVLLIPLDPSMFICVYVYVMFMCLSVCAQEEVFV